MASIKQFNWTWAILHVSYIFNMQFCYYSEFEWCDSIFQYCKIYFMSFFQFVWFAFIYLFSFNEINWSTAILKSFYRERIKEKLDYYCCIVNNNLIVYAILFSIFVCSFVIQGNGFMLSLVLYKWSNEY